MQRIPAPGGRLALRSNTESPRGGRTRLAPATRRLLRDLRAFVVEERETAIRSYCTPDVAARFEATGQMPRVRDISDEGYTREARAEYRRQCRLIRRIDEALGK